MTKLSAKYAPISKRLAAVVSSIAIAVSGLVAGVAAPASATAPTLLAPQTAQSLGDGNAVSPRSQVIGDYVYTITGSGYYQTDLPASLTRASLVDATATPLVLASNGPSTTCDTSATVGTTTIGTLANPKAITGFGNFIYVLDCAGGGSRKPRIIRFDISSNPTTAITGTVVANEVLLGSSSNDYQMAVDSSGNLYLGLSGTIKKLTWDGSVFAATTFATLNSADSIFSLRTTSDGTVFVRTYSNASPLAYASKFWTLDPISGLSQSAVATVSGTNSLWPSEFAVDPSSGDIFFYDSTSGNNIVKRIVKNSDSTYASAPVAALDQATVITTAIRTSPGSLNSSVTSLNLTVDGAVDVQVGDKVRTGSIISTNMNSLYSYEGIVNAVATNGSNKVLTVRLFNPVSGGTYVDNGYNVLVSKYVNTVQSIFASSRGLGIIDSKGTTSGSYSTSYVVGTIANSGMPALAANIVSLNAVHRGATASWNLPYGLPTVTGLEISLWSGTTAAEAVNAASAAGTPSVTCIPDTLNTTSCAMYSGLEIGKYYAVRMKLTGRSGSTYSVAPSAPTQNSGYTSGQVILVSDSPAGFTLPSDAPTGTGPGYAHVATTASGAAIELLRSSAPRYFAPDNNGGQYVAIQSGNSVLSDYKVVHVNADGTADTSFGTNGVQNIANQFSSGSRTISFVATGDRGWAFLDKSSDSNSVTSYRLTYQQGSGTSVVSYPFADADLSTLCNSTFTRRDTGFAAFIASGNKPSLIATAASAPIISMSCGMRYAGISGYVNKPILLQVQADNSPTLFANILGDQTVAEQTAAGNKNCTNISTSTFAASPATVQQADTLTQMFTTVYDMSSMGCMSGVQTAVTIKVSTSGAVTITPNGLTAQGSPQYSSAIFDGSGAFYLVGTSMGMVSGPTVTKINADGTLNTAFGTSGVLTLTSPTCAGTPSTVFGITSGASGRKYLTYLSKKTVRVSNVSTTTVMPVGYLLDRGTSQDEVGSLVMGVAVTATNWPNSAGVNPVSGSAFMAFNPVSSTGNMTVSYFKDNATGLARISWDSFSNALPSGDDVIECPALPFVSSKNAYGGSYSRNFRSVKLSNGKFFIWGNSGLNPGTMNKAEILDPGSNATEGTFAFTAAAPATGDLHGVVMGASVVALPNNKVLVSGGSYYDQQSMSGAGQMVAMVYDAATDSWAPTSRPITKARCNATSTLLGNGKVLIIGGDNCASPAVSYTDAELYDPATGTFVAVGSDPGASFASVTSIGNGKWLLLGTPMPTSYAPGPPPAGTSATKLYDETANTFSSGPALNSARVAPTVIPFSNGKILVVGSIMAGGMQQGVPPAFTGEIYTPGAGGAVGTFVALQSDTGMIGPVTGASGIVLPSGKAMIILGTNSMYGMPDTKTVKFDPATNRFTAGDERGAASANGVPYLVGSKVMILGETSSGISVASRYTVYSEPVEAQAAITSTAPRVVKATTGSVTYTVPIALNPVGGKTSVVFANANGSTALTGPVTWNTASKVVLSNNNLSVTVPLPTAAQAPRAGAVTVTIKSGATGTDIIGTTTLTYIATADIPVISSETAAALNGRAGSNVASLPLGATSLLSPNQPGSGLTYTSATAAVCTVSNTGVVTRVSRGTCTINVKQPKGLGNAEKTQAFTWVFEKTAQTITYSDANQSTLPLTEDGTTLVASASSQLALDFESTTDDICAIDDAGVLTTLALGTCTITIDQAGDATFLPATQVTRTISIQNPTQPPVDAPGALIGDAQFGDTPAGDSMASVVATQRMSVAKNINLGRGLKVQYTPTIKAGKVTVIALNPTITSNYMGPITTVFSVPATLQAKAPAGWTKVGTNYNCTVTYGVSKKLAANARAKTVIYKPAKPCTLTATTQVPAGTVVTVKNTWDRRNAKTYVAITGGVQKRTARITLSAN